MVTVKKIIFLHSSGALPNRLSFAAEGGLVSPLSCSDYWRDHHGTYQLYVCACCASIAWMKRGAVLRLVRFRFCRAGCRRVRGRNRKQRFCWFWTCSVSKSGLSGFLLSEVALGSS